VPDNNVPELLMVNVRRWVIAVKTWWWRQFVALLACNLLVSDG
jgi:hypothetical protein